MPGWRENVYYAFGEPPPLEPDAPATATAPSIAGAHRLTAFLDAVVNGSLDQALRMSAGQNEPPKQSSSHGNEAASLAGAGPHSMPAATSPAPGSAARSPSIARLIAEAESKPPSAIVAKLSGKVRAEMFRDIIQSDLAAAGLDEPVADFAFALLEAGFPMNADRARAAATHVANRRSLYSHGANREWLRVYGRYGFTRDIAAAVAKGLVLDGETRGALQLIADRLRASGKPSAKSAQVRLRRTLERLDRITGRKTDRPGDMLPGLRAGFVLDLYRTEEHAFFEAVLGEIARLDRPVPGNDPAIWLTVERARAIRETAGPLAAKLPYLWDRDRLPEPQLFAFDGRDPDGRLLKHLGSLNSPRPAKAWLHKANALAAEIGSSEVRTALVRWTGLLLDTKTGIDDWMPLYAANALGRAMLWAKIPEHYKALEAASITGPSPSLYAAAVTQAAREALASRTLIDHTASAGPNGFNDPSAPFLTIGQDCLPAVKGAVWMLAHLDGSKNAAHLEALAMALLEKRHGEFRSLAAANACIGALGVIGTPEALAALKRIRRHIKDKPVASTTTRALSAGSADKNKSSNVIKLFKRR